MKEFFDTSVFIAAFWQGHPKHEPSLDLVAAASRKRSCCGLHSLAEVYAAMTALPVKKVIPPDQALLFVQQIREKCSVITLDETEYIEALQRSAEHGHAGGRAYDALLLQCAAKSEARTIYTWNLKHFRAIAPELATRIRTP